MVETIAIKKAKETSKQLEEKVKSINELQLNATKEKAEAELMKLHPDFGEIRDSDDFHEWADEQPKWVQDALYDNDNDARSAARAIDLYKAGTSQLSSFYHSRRRSGLPTVCRSHTSAAAVATPSPQVK